MKKPRSQNRNTLRFGCSLEKKYTPHPLTEDLLPHDARAMKRAVVSDDLIASELDITSEGTVTSIATASGKQRKVAKQSYVRATYYGYSELTRCVYAFESSLELDYFNFLNFDGRQSYFDVQPFSVRYEINGQTERYTPDFIVKFNGTTYIVEIKPSKDTQSEEFKHKVRVLKHFFASQNQEFCVLTEHHIHIGERANNLRYLQMALRQSPPIAPIQQFLGSLPTRSMTVRDFQQALRTAELNPDLCRKAVAHKLVKADLTPSWADVALSW